MPLLATLALLAPHAVPGEPLDAAESQSKKPNILMVVSDNQGWRDIGYNGSEIRTPQLEPL